MERRPLVFLDTHIVVWLYDNLIEKLSRKAKNLIELGELRISPMVLLELEYLLEIKRIKTKPEKIYHDLDLSIQLKVDELDFLTAIQQASHLTWTRDPFDRIIVGHAMALKAYLITADHTIQAHYQMAML